MSDKRLTLFDVFMESQEKQNHEQQIKAFKQLFSSIPFDEFWSTFRQLIMHPLAILNREPAVERVVDFIAKAVTTLAIQSTTSSENHEDDNMHPLLVKVLIFLLDITRDKEKAVRFRVCQMISKILKYLGEDTQIDDYLYDTIYQNMIERLRDKVPIVRVHAILALTRLQTPTDPSCPITKALGIIMARDVNFEVRRIALNCIAISKATLPAVVERTFDINEKVRKTAYCVFAKDVPVKALTIEQRVQLLKNGLNDRSDMVKAACSKELLQSWLQGCQGNVLDLLALLDVQGSVAICQTSLSILFKSSSILDLIQKFDILNEKAMIDREKLSCESAFYWRCLLQYIYAAGQEYEEQLDQIRPVCVEFCPYVMNFAEELSKCNDVDQLFDLEFILQQLLQMITVMDLSDQASRKQTEKLLHSLLISSHVGPSLIPHILTSMKLVYTDTENFIRYIAETVSEIREPITTVETQISSEERRNLDKKIAGIRVKLHQLREELSFCIEKQEFEKAAQLKQDISTLDGERSALLGETENRVEEVRIQKNDYFTVLKCLTIVCEVLTVLNIKHFSASLQALMDSQILPGMTSVESDIRLAAVKAIGLCCLVTKDIVMRHLPILMQASQMDSVQVRAIALKCIFDIFHVYGPSAFNDGAQSSADTSADSIIDDSLQPEEADASSEQSVNAAGSSVEDVSTGGWSETASKIIALLSSNLDSEIPELRYIAAEGICKLLLVGRIVSAKLFSHLVLLWYNPLVEDDDALIQILGIFFTTFAYSNSANQELVEEAFIPTLQTVMHAPSTSPLSEINEVNLANFLIQIMDSWHLAGDKNKVLDRHNPCHDSLAVKLCNKILSDPDTFDNKLWFHSLNQLNITQDNTTLIDNLLTMAQEMSNVVYEKNCCKLLAKFTDMLEALRNEKENSNAEDTNKTTEATVDSRTVLLSETTNDAFEEEAPQAQRITRKSRKSVKTPCARKTTKLTMQSDLDDSVFTPMRVRAPVADNDVESTRVTFENLLLDNAKTPMGKTPNPYLENGTTPAGKTPKRPLLRTQDKFTC